ncbi:MAG: biopolymer transporter ExbD [Gemmataceae bacterium]|nr:biopolymer transporter ExbD [Gemmataceae bacterium]
MSQERRPTAPDIAVALPIVPMLDLSFQILFFFMITFNPSKAEGKMSLNLPATGQAKAKDAESVDLSKPSDVDLEIPADFVVLIRASDDSLSLALRSAEKVDEIGMVRGLDEMSSRERQAEVNRLLDKLRAELEKRIAGKREKEGASATDNVKIEANGKARYAMIVAVMDTCVKAGYAQVGFAPPSDWAQQSP